jgi:prepilin-type N-terminal cleavage/methylation domain-containing protein
MTKNSLRGFTLFELLIVIAIVAILSTIAYPVFIGVQERAKALKDLNNLRQIGVVTQLYLNDHENVLFSPATSWMTQLNQNDGSKYLSSWDVFLSPFDNLVSPRTASDKDANSAVSYGVNPNIYLPNNTAMSATKITIPTAFILFAPAQNSNPATVIPRRGQHHQPAGPSSWLQVRVTVVGTEPATSTPGGQNPGPTPRHTATTQKSARSSLTGMSTALDDVHEQSDNPTSACSGLSPLAP